MVFRNPCKKCLVQSMCREICDIKKEYMETHTKIADIGFGRIPVTIAILILVYTVFLATH